MSNRPYSITEIEREPVMIRDQDKPNPFIRHPVSEGETYYSECYYKERQKLIALKVEVQAFVDAFEDEVGVMNVHHYYGRLKDALEPSRD